MYNVKSTASARFSKTEAESVNRVINLITEKTGENPDTFRDAILILAEYAENKENIQPNPDEKTLTITMNAYDCMKKAASQNKNIKLFDQHLFNIDDLSGIMNTVFSEEAGKPPIQEFPSPKNSIVLTSDAYEKLHENIGDFAAKIPNYMESHIFNIEDLSSTVNDAFLKENEILLKLSSDQLEIAETIQENRGYLLKKKNLEKETLAELIKNGFFNRATLGNWHGEWHTGL